MPPDRYELKVIHGTAAELVAAFQSGDEHYDIFQFSGHGDIDPHSGEGRLLLLSRTGEKAAPIAASDIATLLAGRGIRLAVLSACLTAAGDSADPFNIIAESLIKAGIPAVVASLLPVPDASVAAFVGPLYSQLLISGDIDLAVHQGRVKLAIELAVPPAATLEWGIPTLYRHLGGAQIFQP